MNGAGRRGRARVRARMRAEGRMDLMLLTGGIVSIVNGHESVVVVRLRVYGVKRGLSAVTPKKK